jgi:hypothetical protein
MRKGEKEEFSWPTSGGTQSVATMKLGLDRGSGEIIYYN